MSFFAPTRVQAQAHELLGGWQQLTSSAGSCPRCQISFSGGASTLTVIANNGWSATVDVREADVSVVAKGRGRWNGGAGSLASRPFDIDMILRGERLYMTMINELPDGRKRIVRAVFGRPWLGA